MKASFIAATLLAFAIPATPALAKSERLKCLEALHLDVAKCTGTLPAAVFPKDPKKPTADELDKAKKRADAEAKCNKIAKNGNANCMTKSSNP